MLKQLSLVLLLSLLSGCSPSGGPRLLWRAPIASQSALLVQNGTVYVTGFHAGHAGEACRLFALNAETGQERWASAEAVKEVYGEAGGYVFFRNVTDQLVQLKAQTGEKIHASDAKAPAFRKWAIHGDSMFVVNASQEVAAVDIRRDKEVWRRKLPSEPGYQMNLQLAGQQVIVSGNFRYGNREAGMIWSLDAATGKERWHFEAPSTRDFAPLEVRAYEAYILATDDSPLTLHTHVLDANTGKELYPPIGIFDLYGCDGTTVYASSGAFDLPTGRRVGGDARWLSGSVIHKGIAWKCRRNTVGTAEAFLLRNTYDGDLQGNRDWTNTPPNCSLEGFDLHSGKSLYHTPEYKYTNFGGPVEANGVLFHTSIAEMKEGQSGVWAYRLP